jgi:hypothetical protein
MITYRKQIKAQPNNATNNVSKTKSSLDRCKSYQNNLTNVSIIIATNKSRGKKENKTTKKNTHTQPKKKPRTTKTKTTECLRISPNTRMFKRLFSPTVLELLFLGRLRETR